MDKQLTISQEAPDRIDQRLNATATDLEKHRGRIDAAIHSIATLTKRVDESDAGSRGLASVIGTHDALIQGTEGDVKLLAQRTNALEVLLANLEREGQQQAEDVEGLSQLVQFHMVGSEALLALVDRLKNVLDVAEAAKPLALVAGDIQTVTDELGDLAKQRAEYEGQLLELRLEKLHLTRRIETETAFAKAEAPQDGRNAEIRKQQMDMHLAAHPMLAELGERADRLDELIIRTEFESSQLAQRAKMLETRLRAQQSQVVAYTSLVRVISTHLSDLEEVA